MISLNRVYDERTPGGRILRTTLTETGVIYEVLEKDGHVSFTKHVLLGRKACQRPGGGDFLIAAKEQESWAQR